jgi:hypothetical protein
MDSKGRLFWAAVSQIKWTMPSWVDAKELEDVQSFVDGTSISEDHVKGRLTLSPPRHG